MKLFTACTLLLLFTPLLLTPAFAQTPAPLEFSQNLDAPLPLSIVLRDQTGRAAPLGDWFGEESRRPVVLVPGYFSCPNLCSTLFDGVIESLARMGLAAKAYRLLAFSIDPREGVAEARARQAAFAPLLAGSDAHFLTGDAGTTRRLATAIGFPYRWDEATQQYQHPAGFVVVTPDGRVARYFLGVRFAPDELRQSLREAADGRTGSLVDRLVLLCSHYDPQTGKYSLAVMTLRRLVGGLTLAGFLIWILRRRKAPLPRPPLSKELAAALQRKSAPRANSPATLSQGTNDDRD